jgi:hypothetical protein
MIKKEIKAVFLTSTYRFSKTFDERKKHQTKHFKEIIATRRRRSVIYFDLQKQKSN